jgi:hypothetical protein
MQAVCGKRDQSAKITSPPARVPIARQMVCLMSFRTNRQLPSISNVFTPPEWWLRLVTEP